MLTLTFYDSVSKIIIFVCVCFCKFGSQSIFAVQKDELEGLILGGYWQ
jgi:hypothetical protein